ncbi:hypothetical protein [Corynebacterium sp.]|uniref:hypothetical protein n=1 Tax=Corynebacterium sp. TaxID=1720 RepID=UPI0026DC4403|nr:hypothetical protein [Corynebacterium sp.]MDO5076447.1 hypothetical protein [Corynebacterium sp.]
MRLRRRRFQQVFAVAIIACAFGLGACSAGVESSPTTAEPVADGPHAASDRKLAPRTETANAAGTATIIDVDFGNVRTGNYSAPARGVVVLPTQPSGPVPLVIIGHLRAPNCDNGSFAYPCPEGSSEVRFDRGMTYLGERLAEEGYAVVIPDLGGVFVGADVDQPYNQHAMWKDIVGKFIDAFEDNTLGGPVAQAVDRNAVGLVLHSRSGTAVEPAAELFGPGAVKSVFAFGPAYDTFDLAHFSPGPAEIPYLAVTGEEDRDVGASANLWLGHYVVQPRQFAAATVAVPGLGHTLINRAASEQGADDRIGCEERDCPDAAEHERIVATLAVDWLHATLRGEPTELPVRADQPLPNTVADVPARWLAATPGALAQVAAEAFAAVAGGASIICVHTDPMDPTPVANRCELPEQGVVEIATEVNQLTDAHAEVNVGGARGMALHVSPTGTFDAPGTPLTVTLRLRDGREFVQELDATQPALVNRATDTSNGTYRLGTIRTPLPDWVTSADITDVRISSPVHPVALRGVDFY